MNTQQGRVVEDEASLKENGEEVLTEAPIEAVPAGDFETPTEPTVDDLFHQFVSEEEVKQTEKDSILPQGTYTTMFSLFWV